MAATIEQALYALLAGDATLVAIIGTRIYPLRAPQNATYPLLVYQQIASQKVHSMQGGSGLDFSLFQFTFWGSDYLVTKQAAEALRVLLQGYRGTVTVPAVGTVEIEGAFVEATRDAWDDSGAPDSGESPMFGAQVDYQINFLEEPTVKVTS